MRQPSRPYLQHGNRHRKQGSDPIAGIGVDNDWVIATSALGTVTSGSSPVNGAFSSIDYQTDDGSMYSVYTGGAVDVIQMLEVGSYLIRAIAEFPAGRTGTVQLQGVIGGDVTTYDWDTASGGSFFSDIGPGVAYWAQICVVNDLTIPAGAYLTFTQTTGSSMVSVGGKLQIFRLT
jgi:hypothetical protein